MKVKRMVFAILLVGLVLGITSFGWGANFLLDPNGPHSTGVWLNQDGWQPIGPNGNVSKWSVAAWGLDDGFKWPLNWIYDGAGIWRINHPISGYLKWYPSPRGGFGLEISRDTTDDRWDEHDLEIDDALLPNCVAWEMANPYLPLGVLEDTLAPKISSLSELKIKAWQQVVSSFQGTRRGGNEDFASTDLIVIFWNEVARQQIWFYILTYDTRGDYPNNYWNQVGCRYDGAGFRGGGDFYEYIVIDSSPSYGVPVLQPGGSGKTFNLNILPRLIAAINNVPSPTPKENCAVTPIGDSAPLDTNLDHWKPETIYVGSILGGKAAIKTKHDSINLTYILK